LRNLLITLSSIDVTNESSDAVEVVMRHVAARWSVPVVLALAATPHRFNSLQRAVPGISHRLLAESLRRLERDGLVARGVSATRPPTVEYHLTALGSEFVLLVKFVVGWAQAHDEEILLAQANYDAAR
jgi:DNA-binding HxlR family transcriptional regulator